MTDYVLSIDPGLSTGVALLSYEADSPAQLVKGWQFTGGVAGLLNWIDGHMRVFEGNYSFYPDGFYGQSPIDWINVDWICEKFTARATKGFSYTTSSLEPLRGEGALIALGLMPDYTVAEKRWRDPKHQYLVGGKDLRDKKARMHRFLKESGFYLTNKDFPDSPSKDQADDFRSACAHGLAYIARELKSKATFDMISEWTGEADG